MGIKEYESERKEVEVSKSLAQKLYDKQIKDITNISHLDGYKEIKAYWERVRDGANAELRDTDTESLKIIQMKYKIADDFVTFLSNLEKTIEIRQQAKEI